MNAALFRKELRDLLPWGVLGLALGLAGIVELLLEQIDMAPLGQTAGLLNDEDVVFYWVIAFAIGTGLAVREHDDRTLEFLDGLPVSRSRVFLVKCSVMWLLVMVGPLLEIGALATWHLLSRGSLDRELHGALLMQALALQALLLLNGLMLGAAFGRLRSLTWIAAGLAAAGLMLLVERVPRAAVLNPLTLLDWEWTNAALVVDGEAVRTQFVVATLAAVIAWNGFVRAGKARTVPSMSGPVASAVVATATVGVAITVATLLIQPMIDAAPPDVSGDTRYQFPPSPPARTVTRHYRISYPAHEAEAALALADEADAVFERVHELLGLAPGDTIDVDASGSAENTHGTAFFGRLRMELDSEMLAVLAHETAHVAAQRVAGAERDWLWRAASVLSEGLASWVETPFRERVERTDERMLVLAAMHSRRELIVEELANPLALEAQRGVEIEYSAGEALIAALVRLHGESALARLLQAFDDPRLPSDLNGLPLWQSTFQLAGFDLAAVVDEFYRGVDDYAMRYADRIAALPRPRIALVRFDDSIGAMLVVDPPQNDAQEHEFVIRFRPASDSSLADYQHFPAEPNLPVWPGSGDVLGGRICAQPGVELGAEVLYESWTCLPTSEAVDFDALQGEAGAADSAP